mgnify:CR=1 FL=1
MNIPYEAMLEKHKAYCGDAIAQLAIGEIRGGGDKIGGILSNKAMTYAWCNMHNMRPQRKFDSSGELKKYYHKYGTKFEAMLYDTFIKEGYPAAKKIIMEFLVPVKEQTDLTYI